MERNEGTIVDIALKNTLETTGKAARAVALIAEPIEESLNGRDPHTGEPVGSLAIIKDRMLRWAFRKTLARPYRRLRFA